jgi:hypothetical protein
MVSAAGMEDFADEFASRLGVASIGPRLGELLCTSLSQKPKKSSSAAKLVAKAWVAVDTALCIMLDKRPLDDSNEIKMYGPEKFVMPTYVHQGLPMLIIDNFNEATHKNKTFVTKLFQEASQFPIRSFRFYPDIKRDLGNDFSRAKWWMQDQAAPRKRRQRQLQNFGPLPLR